MSFFHAPRKKKRPQTSSQLDIFKQARDLIEQAHPELIFHLVQKIAPSGKREGDEYKPCNPMRLDRSPGSFSINIRKKCWNDFADHSSGDLIKLIADARRIKPYEAAQELIEELNTEQREKEVPPMSAPPASNQKQQQDEYEVISHHPYSNDFPLKEGGNYQDGVITKIYPYKDGGKTISFYTFRYDRPGHKKEFGWLFWGKSKGREKAGWIFRAPPKPRILFGGYRASEQNKTAPILVVEGEKAALAASKKDEWQDYAPVASAGGANAARSSDWTPLRGRDVVIAPDHDEAGMKYARTVYQLLVEAGARSIEIIQWPEHFPKGWDIADDLPEPPQDETTDEEEQRK